MRMPRATHLVFILKWVLQLIRRSRLLTVAVGAQPARVVLCARCAFSKAVRAHGGGTDVASEGEGHGEGVESC